MKARITPVTTEALELTTPRTMASFSSEGAGRGAGGRGKRGREKVSYVGAFFFLEMISINM